MLEGRGDGRQGARGKRRWAACVGGVRINRRYREGLGHHEILAARPRVGGKSADSAVYTARLGFTSSPVRRGPLGGVLIFKGGCRRVDMNMWWGPDAARREVAMPRLASSQVTGSGSLLFLPSPWARWQLESRRRKLASSLLA